MITSRRRSRTRVVQIHMYYIYFFSRNNVRQHPLAAIFESTWEPSIHQVSCGWATIRSKGFVHIP
eukprot:scaffold363_cov331-Pavlova_lutheri.AAC.12